MEQLEQRQLLAVDLVGISLDVTPEPVLWGEKITWAAELKNQGSTDGQPFSYRLYLSADATIDTGDYVANTGLEQRHDSGAGGWGDLHADSGGVVCRRRRRRGSARAGTTTLGR